MYSKSKSQQAKTCKSEMDSCNEDASIQRRTGGKRQRGQIEQIEAQSCYPRVVLEKLNTSDLIHLTGEENCEDKPEEREALVKVPNNGVEQADDDQFSTTSSVVSGPSFPDKISTNKSPTICPACRKLNQRARRMKAPLKDKLLDTNPKSLTCDQWILLKPWSCKIMSDSRGSLLQSVKKLYLIKKRTRQDELLVQEVCSRPHVFLSRNLRCCKRKLLKKVKKKKKKKNWRKRSQEDTLGPRVAKQQRLLNNHPSVSSDFSHDGSIQPISSGLAHSSPDPVRAESEQNSDLTLRPSSRLVNSEIDNSNLHSKKNGPKRGTGFKDLLAQLRGNNSMIIRESSSDVSLNKTLSVTQ